jgi:LysR family transcriptional regulator, low CO2-responsive transcriptional regulator
MNVSFRQLQVFVEVARHLSFARAAQALHLTPPAVTMQVKELESQVQLPLFHREGRKVALTTSGEYFLVYAKRLLATLKDAGDAMARLRKLEGGALTVGLVSTAKYFVPRLLARFRAEHPGVEVRLQVSPDREQLVAAMSAGDVDLAVMGRPPRDLEARAEPFAAHPHVFIAAPDHPLLAQQRLPVAQLENVPLVVREAASGTRVQLDRFLREHKTQPLIAMEMTSNESIKQAVMAGMGWSFLSLHTIGLELRAGVLKIVPVEDTPVVRTWNVVHLRSRVLSPSAEAFRDFMLEHGEAWLAEHDRPWVPQGTTAVMGPAP